MNVRKYGLNTDIASEQPWGTFVWAHAMCSDGRIRKTSRIAITADTFFSVPAAVDVNRKAVSGYITIETAQGYSTETENDPTMVKFVAYTFRKNGHLLPSGAWRKEA